ncbi:Gfo/Idh/MocA family oxidoreductase [Streptomyces sp. CA-210063]|uniref:Gfo/Idh/MocA family protein n=1 Tax=Streptomyces sp. CA-210063 TaxID=2801029 RepID=UPI00214AF746|nr:Gfo/Idh/MocA family oxidoreductase [Streptomyces sp. CA-210063]UUU30447.1 Gfo/Idh/MocA family oxidoreductase [Streptomyces sp. CA-210063]
MVNLRAAIVGCGRIAAADHAAAHTADPRVNLAVVVDPDHDRARAMARRFGVREVFTSLEEMLATTDVDLVSVCAPPHLHAPLAVTALQAGCHVLCEPPAATSAADVTRMAAVAAAERRVLTFGFHLRHLTEARTARGIVDAGEIGEIHDVQLTATARRDTFDRPRAGRGDGPLTDIGIHLLDLAMWLTGFPEAVETLRVPHDRTLGRGQRPEGEVGRAEENPAQVVKRAFRPARGTSRAEDTATGLVRHRDGMSLSITTSYAARSAHEETVRVRLLGDNGDLEISPLPPSHPNPLAPGHSRPAPPGKAWDQQLAHRRQIAAFVDACLGRGPVPVTPAEAIHVQEIVDRLHRSAHGTVLERSDPRGAAPAAVDDLVQEASRA